MDKHKHPPPNEAGITRILRAGMCSFEGLKAAWRTEPAFRQEIFLCLVLLPLAVFLGGSGVERALLVSSVLLIPIVEIVNSAIEAVVDRVGTERHILSGRAKDMGSAAVGLALFHCLIVWVMVLFP